MSFNPGQLPPNLAGYFVDWISVVFTYVSWAHGSKAEILQRDVEFEFQRLGIGRFLRPTKPRFGYTVAFQDVDTGAIAQFSPERHETGVNVILTGGCLQKVGWRDALTKIVQTDGRFTRLDFTVDVVDDKFDMADLYAQTVSGMVKTRSRRHSYVTSSTGNTMYVGSRSANKFLRVYDKGAEQNGLRGVHYRIELECKGEAAGYMARTLYQGRDTRAYAGLLAFFNAPNHDGWQKAFAYVKEREGIPSDKRRHDTRQWLFTTVARTLAEECRRDPEMWGEFEGAISSLLALE